VFLTKEWTELYTNISLTPEARMVSDHLPLFVALQAILSSSQTATNRKILVELPGLLTLKSVEI
jgi:hypothetical protein